MWRCGFRVGLDRRATRFGSARAPSSLDDDRHSDHDPKQQNNVDRLSLAPTHTASTPHTPGGIDETRERTNQNNGAPLRVGGRSAEHRRELGDGLLGVGARRERRARLRLARASLLERRAQLLVGHVAARAWHAQ